MITLLKRFLLMIAALAALSSCYREVVVYKDSGNRSAQNNKNPQIYQNFRTQNPMLYNPYQSQKNYYQKYDHDYYYMPPRNYGKYEFKI
jgi:hypothetical protein